MTSPRTTDTRPAPSTVAAPITLAATGALFAAGALLHPKGEPAAQLTDPAWNPAHTVLLVALVALAPALYTIVRSRGAGWPSPVRTAALVVSGAAVLGIVEMVPHLLASTEAVAHAHGGPTPFNDTHQRISLFSNAAVGLSLAVLAVLAARTRALGGGAGVAALAVVGGVAFAVAAPLLVSTGNPLFAILFSGSVLMGLWLLVSGVLLARRA